jgi:hypothetical protein
MNEEPCRTLNQGRKLLQSLLDEVRSVYGGTGSRIPYVEARCMGKNHVEQYRILGGNGYKLNSWAGWQTTHKQVWFARRMMAEMHKNWEK